MAVLSISVPGVYISSLCRESSQDGLVGAIKWQLRTYCLVPILLIIVAHWSISFQGGLGFTPKAQASLSSLKRDLLMTHANIALMERDKTSTLLDVTGRTDSKPRQSTKKQQKREATPSQQEPSKYQQNNQSKIEPPALKYLAYNTPTNIITRRTLNPNQRT